MSAAAADAGDAPAKKGSKKMIIIIAVVALLLVVGGGAAFFLMKKKSADEEEGDGGGGGHAKAEVKHEAPKPKAVDPHAVPTFVPLDAFVVNLADTDTDKYAQIGIPLLAWATPLFDFADHAWPGAFVWPGAATFLAGLWLFLQTDVVHRAVQQATPLMVALLSEPGPRARLRPWHLRAHGRDLPRGRCARPVRRRARSAPRSRQLVCRPDAGGKLQGQFAARTGPE